MNKIDFDNNGLNAWETNATFWDDQMGDNSNYFHCDIVRPSVDKLLEINENDFVLEVACGNGNYASYLASKGVQVVAFDYSEKMIELAKKRRKEYVNKIDFQVCDATSYEQLLQLKRSNLFTKAVANMAIMDISKITPLFKAIYQLLDNNGTFVFATHHPCFTYPNDDYFTNCIEKGIAIEGQPTMHNYYHRTISDIFKVAFECGFVVDGFHEIPFNKQDTPIIMIVRVRKI